MIMHRRVFVLNTNNQGRSYSWTWGAMPPRPPPNFFFLNASIYNVLNLAICLNKFAFYPP